MDNEAFLYERAQFNGFKGDLKAFRDRVLKPAATAAVAANALKRVAKPKKMMSRNSAKYLSKTR